LSGARIIGALDSDGKAPGQPMFYVFHDPAEAEDLDTSSQDHVADEVRYALPSRPWTRTVKEAEKPLDAYPPPSDDIDHVQSSVKLL
jgi:hypothetical protein